MCSSWRDYILLLLPYFKLFSSKNASGAYRMENLSAWRKVHKMHAFKMFITAVWLLLLLSAIFSVPELGTMSKNSFRETALGIRPLWGIHSSRTLVPPPPPFPWNSRLTLMASSSSLSSWISSSAPLRNFGPSTSSSHDSCDWILNCKSGSWW